MPGGDAAARDQLNVSRKVKGNRQEELSRVVRHRRGRNIITPWKSGRRPPERGPQVKNAAYALGFAVGARHAV